VPAPAGASGEAGSLSRIAARYARFAAGEARGRSPLYEALALGVAADRQVLHVLAGLPVPKQQPNLLFAAVRLLHGTPADWPAFRRALLDDPEAVTRVMLARSTQTNEPGRCAVLLPLLALLPQPLALIEVGASAGLCLLPDRYAYDYGCGVLGPGGSAPVFPCRADAATPLPDRLPVVALRAGLDLAPVDLGDPDAVAWLETLVWPEQTARLERLRAAIRVAREAPPPVRRGDLRTDLPALAAEAPRGATLVVFHTAVLAYLDDPAERAAFAASLRGMGAIWIANEAPGALPGLAADVAGAADGRSFLLCRDGAPMAWTDPHGAAIHWLGPRQSGSHSGGITCG